MHTNSFSVQTWLLTTECQNLSGESLQNPSLQVSYSCFLPCRAQQQVSNVSQITAKNMSVFSTLWLTTCHTLRTHIIKLTHLVKEAGYEYTSNSLQLLFGPDIINTREVLLIPDINISCLSGQWQLSKNVRQLRWKTVFWTGAQSWWNTSL